jgi:hypothetical protein
MTILVAWNSWRNTVAIYEICGGMLTLEQETKTYDVTKWMFALKSRVLKT